MMRSEMSHYADDPRANKVQRRLIVTLCKGSRMISNLLYRIKVIKQVNGSSVLNLFWAILSMSFPE